MVTVCGQTASFFIVDDARKKTASRSVYVRLFAFLAMSQCEA